MINVNACLPGKYGVLNMGWKVPSKQGTGKVLEWRLWIAGGEDAAEETWRVRKWFLRQIKKATSSNVCALFLLTCLWWRSQDRAHSKLEETWILWGFGRAGVARHRGGSVIGRDGEGGADRRGSSVYEGGGSAYPQQVLYQEAGVSREGGRQSRGRSVQPRVKSGRR